MGHNISLPLANLTAVDIGILVAEIGNEKKRKDTWTQYAEAIVEREVDGSVLAHLDLDKDDINDLMQELGIASKLDRIVLLNKLKTLKEKLKNAACVENESNIHEDEIVKPGVNVTKLTAPTKAKAVTNQEQEATKRSTQVPICICFNETGDTVKLMVDPILETVKSLKLKLVASSGVPLNQLRLTFGGRLIEDFLALSQCNIVEESIITATRIKNEEKLPEDIPECRFCHEGTTQVRPLLSACLCSSLVHRDCLNEWLGRCHKDSCEVCTGKYIFGGSQQQPQPVQLPQSQAQPKQDHQQQQQQQPQSQPPRLPPSPHQPQPQQQQIQHQQHNAHFTLQQLQQQLERLQDKHSDASRRPQQQQQQQLLQQVQQQQQLQGQGQAQQTPQMQQSRITLSSAGQGLSDSQQKSVSVSSEQQQQQQQQQRRQQQHQQQQQQQVLLQPHATTSVSAASQNHPHSHPPPHPPPRPHQHQQQHHQHQQHDRTTTGTNRHLDSSFSAPSGSLQIAGAASSHRYYNDINGVYELTEEISGDMPVYHNTVGGWWLEYYSPTSEWQIKGNAARGSNSFAACCVVDAICLPQDCPLGLWQVTPFTTEQHSLTISLIDEAPLLKTGTVPAGAQNKGTDSVSHGGVRLTGATSDEADINSVYELTEEISGDMPVYHHVGDDDLWFVFMESTDDWNVQNTADKGTNASYAFCTVPSKCLPHECSVGEWQIGDDDKFIPQPALTVSSVTRPRR